MSFEKHPNAKKVFDYYEDRYSSGALGLWHLCGVASTRNKLSHLILSSLIIANKGSYKSQIMKSFAQTYKEQVWSVPSQPTDRAIVREFKTNPKKIMNKLWYIDDAAVTFPTLEGTRQERLIGLFTTGIMDQNYSYSDFSQTQGLTGKFGLFVNIAFSTFHTIRDIILTNTFTDRVLPFNFVLSDDVLNKTAEDYVFGKSYEKPPKLSMIDTRMKPFVRDESLNEFRYARDLLIKYCTLAPPRACDWLKVILESIAIIEKRNYVIAEDIKLFNKYLLPQLSLDVRVFPVEKAILRCFSINQESTMHDCKDFFKSTLCENEFPVDYVGFREMKDAELSKYFNTARLYYSVSKEVKVKHGVEIDVI